MFSHNIKASFWCPDQQKSLFSITCPELDLTRHAWNLKVVKAFAHFQEDVNDDAICFLTSNVKSQKTLVSPDNEYKIVPLCIGVTNLVGKNNAVIELRGLQENPMTFIDSDTGNRVEFELRKVRGELFTKKVWLHLLINLTKLR